MSYFKGFGSKSKSFTGRKMPMLGLMKGTKKTIFNEYTHGSGVGASSAAVRRMKKQRARIKKCPQEEIVVKTYEEGVIEDVDELVEELDLTNKTTEQVETAVKEIAEKTRNAAVLNYKTADNAEVDEIHFVETIKLKKEDVIADVELQDKQVAITYEVNADYNIFDETADINLVEKMKEDLGVAPTIVNEVNEDGESIVVEDNANVQYKYDITVLIDESGEIAEIGIILIDKDTYTE